MLYRQIQHENNNRQIQRQIQHENKKRLEIKNYFLNLNYNEQDHEIVEIIDYIREYGFSIFPYKFVKNYHARDVDVFYDESNKTSYVIHENKSLYFPNDWNMLQIQDYYNWLAIEQDKDSPHRYEVEGFSVKDGDNSGYRRC